MKLSLRWIFDHLSADWKKCNVGSLIEKFNATTAEIDGVEKVSFDASMFALAKVTKTSDKELVVDCPEWKKKFTLSGRDDANKDDLFVIKKTNKGADWATVMDWGGIKEKLLPAMTCAAKDVAGGWKKILEKDDYIIEVDNKSITNRPDMWGHRGFAREFSFLLKVPFQDDKKFLAPLKQKKADKSYKASGDMPFNVLIDAKGCNRFSAMTIDNVTNRPSDIWMALRLCRIESSPIDFIVDATNYAMFDYGQPIHAFDATMFKNKTITARDAKQGEKLTLLDGTELTLTKDDMVITDGENPVSLAGIKGGLKSGVAPTTASLLIESANFDAAQIRKTAGRHKVRTDASARFEKTPDRNQNVEGTMRFVQLLKDAKMPIKVSKILVSLGKEVKPVTIKVDHEFIEDRIGVELTKNEVQKLLESIGFGVVTSGLRYTIKVPSKRASKDVTIPEDIVEEVARLYGYQNIPYELPKMILEPATNLIPEKIRAIKQQLAFDGAMREVQNYGFLDNDFMRRVGWKVVNPLKVSNPVAEHLDTMVTSLIPRLLQNIEYNKANNDSLQFFELARVWDLPKKNEVIETQSLAGIFFHKKQVDFYTSKAVLDRLLEMLGFSVEWKTSTKKLFWASKYQTADLYIGLKYIGTAGKVSLPLMAAVAQGDAFAFELNADLLLELKPKEKEFKGLPKYQATTLDVSIMVPFNLTVADLKSVIEKADERIYDVHLVDLFEKEEWKDKRSVTLRFSLRDDNKTLSKDEIDAGYKSVQKALQKQGAEIR